LGSDLRPRVNDEGPKSTGAFFSQYDPVFAVEREMTYKRF
jgi:hypothetical protein